MTEQKHSNNTPNEITTKDLYFSACLKALGYEFINAERNGDGTVYFTFRSNVEDLKTLQNEYYLNDIQVGARTYSIAWKTLRRVLDRT